MTNRAINDDRRGSAEHAHQAIRDMLPDYATAAALGNPPETTYPDVAVHLRHCDACRSMLDELLELTVAAYAGEVAAAPTYPQIDLSFLRPATPPPRARAGPWRIDEAGRLVVEFSEALLAALKQPSFVGATRGQLLYRYAQEPGSVEDLDLTIEVFADAAARGMARVCVGVDLPSRDPLDQAGSEVVLRAGDASWREATDESGCADFAGVPLAAIPMLRVEVAPRRPEGG